MSSNSSEGFVEAFRSPLVHQAIRGGMLGRIAVVYAEWAGSTVQHVVVPWTVIEAAEEAAALADRLAAAPIQRSTLQTAGLITQSRGVITVADRAGLEEAACECYGVIRGHFSRLLPGTYSRR